MADDKKRLITSILHFLRDEFRSGQLSAEIQEGLEVAIQCLESIYEIKDTTRTEPSLLEIYKTFLVTTIINQPDASEEDKQRAEKLKTEGNTAMSQGEFNKALELYTRAIAIDPKNAVYYCNRAAVHSKMLNYSQTIIDCKIALEIDPKYSKAYGRLGFAYCGLGDYASALEYYKKALELEPTNVTYLKNYELALEKINETTSEASTNMPGTIPVDQPVQDLNALFGNPQLLNIASQMLSDPTMQNMMSNLISSGLIQDRGATGMQELLNVGQRLAQQMHTENPQFVAELRAALNRTTHSDVDSQHNNASDTEESANDDVTSSAMQTDQHK